MGSINSSKADFIRFLAYQYVEEIINTGQIGEKTIVRTICRQSDTVVEIWTIYCFVSENLPKNKYD